MLLEPGAEFRRHWMTSRELARVLRCPERRVTRMIFRGLFQQAWRDPVTRVWWLPRTLRGARGYGGGSAP